MSPFPISEFQHYTLQKIHGQIQPEEWRFSRRMERYHSSDAQSQKHGGTFSRGPGRTTVTYCRALPEGRVDFLKKIIDVIADLFPVALALIFATVVVLSVCHATTAAVGRVDRGASTSQQPPAISQGGQPSTADDVADAVRSGEWEMFMPWQGP